jgi:hypothetical protein
MPRLVASQYIATPEDTMPIRISVLYTVGSATPLQMPGAASALCRNVASESRYVNGSG